MGTLLTPWKTWAGVTAFSFCSARTCTEPPSLAAMSAGSAGCPALAAPGFAPQVPLEEPLSPGQRRRCGSTRSKREPSPLQSPQLCLPIILSDELLPCHHCCLAPGPVQGSGHPWHHRSITSNAPSVPAQPFPPLTLTVCCSKTLLCSPGDGCPCGRAARPELFWSELSPCGKAPLWEQRRKVPICTRSLFIHIHTHKNAAKCFLRGRWDQRAPLTYTILPFCQFLVNKIFQAGAGSSCSLGSTPHRSCSSPSPLLWHFTSPIHHNPDRTSKASCQGSTPGNPPVRKEIIAPA